ncbi:MAG: DegV family protein [Lachnospiraceae bacterium]|nr:DegV family protein [Lachnospiraceae bacterium]
MMNDYIIITDSATDMPKEIVEKYNLHVIPTPVVIEGKDYFDGETVFPKEFYQYQRDGKEISTYHINTFMFKEHFRPYAERNETVVYVCFSTGLAATFNAARMAKEELQEEFPDWDMTIVDSKCASLGFGLLVYYALVMQEHGADKQTVIEALEYHREHIKHVFTVETLEYLYKGGRLSKTSMVVGGVLDIKPIIHMDENGSLKAIEKVRGRHKSLKRMVEIIGEWCQNPGEQLFGICHGDDYATMKQTEEMIKETYGEVQFLENYVGCAIGAHTGTGIIGIVFLDEESKYKDWL